MLCMAIAGNLFHLLGEGPRAEGYNAAVQTARRMAFHFCECHDDDFDPDISHAHPRILAHSSWMQLFGMSQFHPQFESELGLAYDEIPPEMAEGRDEALRDMVSYLESKMPIPVGAESSSNGG